MTQAYKLDVYITIHVEDVSSLEDNSLVSVALERYIDALNFNIMCQLVVICVMG